MQCRLSVFENAALESTLMRLTLSVWGFAESCQTDRLRSWPFLLKEMPFSSRLRLELLYVVTYDFVVR